jgi:hypothetical protein
MTSTIRPLESQIEQTIRYCSIMFLSGLTIVEQEVSVMEVASVSSSVSTLIAASAQAQVRAPQPEPDRQAQQTQQSRQAQSTEPAQSSQSGDVREAADRARAEAERSQPSVNSNGQTVGTRVNTTA